MTVPALAARLVVVGLICVAAASCTQPASSIGGPTPTSAADVALAPPSGRTTATGVGRTSMVTPVQGSSSAIPTRRCVNGSEEHLVAGAADLAAGPVRFPDAKLLGSPAGLSNFYGGGEVPDGPDGSKFYKMGTSVQAGATVTVTVAASARSYLRLQQGPGPHEHGELSVVFQACPGGSYTGWVGGFDIKGRMPRCVALDVQVAGERASRRLLIAFGGNACAE